MWPGNESFQAVALHSTCSPSPRATLIDSMEKGKAGCWQDWPGGKCQRAGVKARGGGTWQASSSATGTHSWVTSKIGSVSGDRGSSKTEDQRKSDPSRQKCYLAFPFLYICDWVKSREIRRGQKTERGKVSLGACLVKPSPQTSVA